ncbi:hypothetical protein [Methylobacterium durans]|uniref:hypothetical protein n=1 Tax=Methylobacterium durans TaxID=2202825 RepID=UPI00187F8D1F|nr:hypothetical protein [Methylobacterium durans]
MINLLLYYAFFAALAVNVSLVFYVADFLNPKADAAPARPLVVSNENAPASVKLAA